MPIRIGYDIPLLPVPDAKQSSDSSILFITAPAVAFGFVLDVLEGLRI
jgi:hypothetical protein